MCELLQKLDAKLVTSPLKVETRSGTVIQSLLQRRNADILMICLANMQMTLRTRADPGTLAEVKKVRKERTMRVYLLNNR